MRENPGRRVVRGVENQLLHSLRGQLSDELDAAELESLAETLKADIEDTVNSAAGVSIPDRPGGRPIADGSGGDRGVE
jgi:hypothetical protein